MYNSVNHKASIASWGNTTPKGKRKLVCLTNGEKRVKPNTPNLKSRAGEDRILEAYALVIRPDGRLARARVKLDTGSNVTLIHPMLGTPRQSNSWESASATGLANTTVPLGNPVTLTMYKHGSRHKIDAREGPPGLFDDGSLALISLHHIKLLNIDLHVAVDSTEPTDIQFRKGVNANHMHAIKNAMDMAIEDRRAKEALTAPLKKVNMCELYEEVLEIHTPPLDPYIAKPAKPPDIKPVHTKVCYLADRIIQQYNEINPDEFVQQPLTVDGIQTENLQAECKQRFLACVQRNTKVFAVSTNTLPPAMKVEPHSFQFKPGAKPVSEPRPHFGKAKEQYLENWKDWALKGAEKEFEELPTLISSSSEEEESSQLASLLLSMFRMMRNVDGVVVTSQELVNRKMRTPLSRSPFSQANVSGCSYRYLMKQRIKHQS